MGDGPQGMRTSLLGDLSPQGRPRANLAYPDLYTIYASLEYFIPYLAWTFSIAGHVPPASVTRRTENCPVFQYANDNICLPIHLLGLIVND